VSLAPSKRGGANAAAAVIQTLPELRHVPDSEAESWDAETTTLLEPSADLPFAGICLLERGTIVEIKSAMVVYGERQRRGRFLIRRGQHQRLLELAGSYLFAVCEPTPDRDVLAMKVVPASLVDEFGFSWIDREQRSSYAQFAWTRVFRPSEVDGSASR
jgi:hypothetical protein